MGGNKNGLPFSKFLDTGPEIVDLVAGLILPGEDAGAAHHADGGGDKGALEDVALPGEDVKVGCPADLVSGKTEGVVTQVVDEEEEDVWSGGGGGGGREAQEKRQDGQENSHAGLL